MIAIIEETGDASKADFMVNEDGERYVFKTYHEAENFLMDEAMPGITYQKWADCNHEGDE